MASDFDADTSEIAGSRSWTEELASLVEDTGIRYPVDVAAGIAAEGFDGGEEAAAAESLKDQVKGFLKASAEMLGELGRGCRDVAVQSLGKEDSFVVRKLGGPWKLVSGRLSFLNEYLPEDRDPVHAWPVVISVFLIAFAGARFVNWDWFCVSLVSCLIGLVVGTLDFILIDHMIAQFHSG